jgi:hypothetical protein
MNFIGRYTKVFAILSLFFANNYVASAQDSIYRLPAGTTIRLSMDAGISSKISSVNDTFTTTVIKPITVDNVVVLPYGTVIEGRVTGVSSAGPAGKIGRMELTFETIRFSDSVKRSIDGVLVNEIRAGVVKADDLRLDLGGAAAGALIGSASGTNTGILAGAGIGAGAGSAVAFLKKGKDVHIRTDERIRDPVKERSNASGK